MEITKPFYSYNLGEARRALSPQTAFSHQSQALDELKKWFNSATNSNAGGIVVLPTGGGKTFTAIRFLCSSVIGKGYKVLWLAHTHHLLEQAYFAFVKSVATIPEPKPDLALRIVSGTPGHHPPHRIEPTDDVVVATLQTTTMAFENNHPALLRFLEAAGDRLCIIFDEAHHSPAPSYRKLLASMRAKHAKMILIGLTATPTNNNPRKTGWLKELFPQGIIHQTQAQELIAARRRSRPNFEKIPTAYSPDFDEAEYSRWVETYRDLPESIIESLSKNKDRNALIASHYVSNRDRYGKTIIFAERWYQCEQIESFLSRHGVKAGSVYNQVDGSPSRTTNDNHRTLEKYKNGEIDVLINVKMLIEGTDVPQTKSVFITRQTTSAITLTQMVGRALRGPAAGGTEEAYIVSFEDNWNQKINWAGFDQLAVAAVDSSEVVYGKRPPVQMISIDLVRRLADQMDSGINVAPMEFIRLMPIGWYSVEFQALVEGTDDVETVRQLVMVFEDQKRGYDQFLASLLKSDLTELSSERATIDKAEALINKAISLLFSAQTDEMTRVVPKDLFHLARHVAQNDGELPRFFPFEDRIGHDLDAVSNQHLDAKLGLREIDEALRKEFHRRDRYWTNLYTRYELFKTQYDACVNRILQGPTSMPTVIKVTDLDDVAEIGDEVKRQVKLRDQKRCLCCGESNTRRLEVDHINPKYFGGSHSEDNLQTLCKVCNKLKSIKTTNFRVNRDEGLQEPPTTFPLLILPKIGYEGVIELWVQSLRRSVNVFYKAAAVEEILIGAKGRGYYEWIIRLHDGNRPDWLAPHLPGLLDSIRSARKAGRVKGPEGICIVSTGFTETAHFAECSDEHRLPDFPQIPNGTECRICVGDQLHDGIFFACDLKLKFGNRTPFASFSEAYKTLAGRQRNDWRGWEFRLPNWPEWVRGDLVRQRLIPNATDE